MKRNLFALLLLISTVCPGQDSLHSNGSKHHWYVPDGVSAEYAGGFGMISAGILYHWSKNSEVGLTAGYTPHEYGNMWSGNFLISYTLLPVRISKHIELNLLKTGVFINFNFGKNVYVKWPSYYPENYYWWNSSVRYGPFIDSEVKFKPEKSKLVYALFFQCLTNDLYLYTYFPNTRFVKLEDIIYFGAGIRITGARR